MASSATELGTEAVSAKITARSEAALKCMKMSRMTVAKLHAELWEYTKLDLTTELHTAG